MNDVPVHVTRFRDALLGSHLDRIDLEFGRTRIQGQRGILTTSRVQYNHDPTINNLLNRDLEYTFSLPEQRLEISLQLYLNESDHWRLFAFCRSGMLSSLNLTLLRKNGAQFTVHQILRLSARKMTQDERKSGADSLCAFLQSIGMEVDENRRLTLGIFDANTGQFVDTTVKHFLRSFLTAALIKGHFMGNKGYKIPGLPSYSKKPDVGDKSIFPGRSIPPGLRWNVYERDNFKCCACGHGREEGVKLHVDHIIPVSQGGLTEMGNLQVLCATCNLGKGNRSVRKIGERKSDQGNNSPERLS